MVRPNPRYEEEDIFVMIDGYSRNLVLEEKLERESAQVNDLIKNMGEFNPTSGYAVPSWWERVAKDVNQDPADSGSGYGWGFDTHQKALDYLEISKRYYQAKINLYNYKCKNYPRDPSFCQHVTQFGGTLGKINSLIPIIENRITAFQFPDISFPEILPEVSAQEEQLTLSNNVIQIINDINNNVIQIPDWFRNNVEWVKTGHINEQEFLTAYNYLEEQQIAHPPTEQEVITQPIVNDSISNNMIIQRLDNFTIIDGRAKGTITFTATSNFNPYYYNKNIINIIQFKTLEGANILPTVKTNNLRFTATERTETLHYDEDMNGNTAVSVESFVWEWIDKPLGAFSTVLRFNIDSNGKIQSEGFMGAGIAVSAIAFTLALGYIIDQRGKK